MSVTLPESGRLPASPTQGPPKAEGRARTVIESVSPQLDGGQFAIKRIVGDSVLVRADVFNDGHDLPSCVLLYRREDDQAWREQWMEPLGNDRWQATFTTTEVGRYVYTIEAWTDRFRTWSVDLSKRIAAGQDIGIDLRIGAGLIEAAADNADGQDRAALLDWVRRLLEEGPTTTDPGLADDGDLQDLMRRYAPRLFATRYERELPVVVDHQRGQCSAWYEMFPRSAADEPGRHGTLADCEARLPYVAKMGFDVLYLPPIHPIGTTYRKGPNNQLHAGADDVGSPWAIGSPEGGHKSVHPRLGTLDDFRRLVDRAAGYGLQVALDIAFQCSPDHPYVRDHPEWFRRRPDGTIQYAENPPKKYQDIYPFDFETDDWQALWDELKSVFLFWIQQGVRIFRVDNPHTKPFAFWEWCIGEIKRSHPDTLFLAEAFTRPKIMHRLAKLGFSQSYTYFAWRNTKHELVTYATELTQTDLCEFFRPNFWPNTPDILTEHMQLGGRPTFMARLVLAATLSSNYGIYGPPFEHCWNQPSHPGSEEYRDSEKYQLHYHDLQRPDSLKNFVARVNRIRREHTALQSNKTLEFHPVDNDDLIAYSKQSPDAGDLLLVVVNLDPRHRQSGWLELPLERLGLDAAQPYQVHDLLSDARFLWHGPRNYVELHPQPMPAHIFRVRRRIRTERDFEYYL